MNKIPYFLLFLAIPLLFMQCQKEGTEPEPPQVEEPKEDYEFRLRLLNENLEEATEFEHGKNIVFSFLMTNNTNKKTYLEHFKNTDFLRVYQKQEGATKDINHGLPYDYFLQGLITYISLFANTQAEIRIPWVYAPENRGFYESSPGAERSFKTTNPERHQTYLEKGEYYIRFKQSFPLSFPYAEPIVTEEKPFEYKFIVK